MGRLLHLVLRGEAWVGCGPAQSPPRFFFSYACHEPQLVSHKTASSSTECSRDTAIQFCQGTGFDNVEHRLGLATRMYVAISLSRHRSVPVPCKNGSAETAVAEGGQNLVAGLWGHTLGEN